MLVVDDEEGPRQSLNMIFNDEFDVTMASSGEEAVRIAESNPFDVVITDIRMRGLSGIDVLREMKRLDKHTQVIVLTAFETLETARQAISLGASEYLKKPFDLEHIQNVVNRCYESYLFSTQQEELVRKDVNAAKTNFLEIVGHELNTPMNGIIGFIDLLEESNIDEEQREFLKMIRDCSTKYYDHVQDILTYAKLSMSEAKPQVVTFNPATLLLKVVSDSEVPEGVTLTSEIPNDLPEFVTAAETEIRIVIRKILQNALKFVGTGNVVLGVEFRYLSDSRARFRFYVTDSGPGIPNEIVKDRRLFDAFTQADSSLSRPHGGLGLGLALCERIAEKLEGRILVDSELNIGSTFSFELDLFVEEI